MRLRRSDEQPSSTAPSRPTRIAVRGVVHGHAVAAVGAMQKRLTEPWTLDSLAAEVHLSTLSTRESLRQTSNQTYYFDIQIVE